MAEWGMERFIVRRMPKKRGKSTARKLRGRLTRSSRKRPPSLKELVQSLEKRVEALEHGVPIFGFPEKTKKKRGARKKIPDEELFEIRDALIDWLELNWPDVGPKILSAAGPEEIVAALVPYAGPGTSRGWLIKRLIDNAGSLLSFLNSDKFRRRPPKQTVVDALNRPYDDRRRIKAAARLPTRKIANAMAGVPENKWPTSLGKCSKEPCLFVVGKKTEDYYRELFRIPVPKSKRRRRQGKP